MATPAPNPADAPTDRTARPRDSGASRTALLAAARDLFGQRGFEGTTIRDIGERAGVDGALVARYFGGKADLYVAAVVAEDGSTEPYRSWEEIVATVVARADDNGPGPILQALTRADVPEEIRRAARARLTRRLVEPLVGAMEDRGTDRPRLRAEVAVSALLGVSLGRSLGWFEETGTVPVEELVPLVDEALARLIDSDGIGLGTLPPPRAPDPVPPARAVST